MSLFYGGRRSMVVLVFLLALTLLIPTFVQASQPVIAAPIGDLGDAPDSTNHFGVAMLAYPPATNGRYPTVFDPALGVPQGPLHQNVGSNGWLGQGISREQDADLLPDGDGITNLDPPTNTPNRDRFDDGVPPPNGGVINLPQCANTQFRYIVTGAGVVPAPNARVNVWFDWNRDGDWADRFSCTTPSGAVLAVYEWAVRNQAANIVPGSVVWATPLFPSFHPAGHSDTWMRISIAEINAPIDPLISRADGRGPANGYTYGETEDYIARYSGGVAYKPQ
jgi:hypothetical protein